ncbi:hypothetical protein ACRALDRAFT_1066868 [Sodiomyces alcalophilus JCM 7366]|uniref:uncharacterized protein n=1 Tax=Sodiomyces alcalophilus JCM 7366 TaxID=591952 RepID=UPI0039B59CDA
MASIPSAMNVQITFLPGTFSLIHFPPELYANFLQPVLGVLLPQTQTVNSSRQWPDHDLEGLTSDDQHTFLNVSVTPLECSVVCHTSWARSVFEPAIAAIPKEARKSAFISQEPYLVLSVISGDIDIVSRILELTCPLALAGISIFFISTYYSDFILVPAKDRELVVKALTERGFVLHRYEKDSFVASRHGYITPTIAPVAAPSPATIAELFSRTFNQLKKRSVEPIVQDGLRLVQLSARDAYLRGTGIGECYIEDSPRRFSQSGYGRNGGANGRHPPQPLWIDTVDARLYASLISALVSQPRFFSLTMAIEDPPSLLLDRNLLPLFGDILIGDRGNELVPISLDLVNMPFEATGIVCGVAGKIVQELTMTRPGMSYLSTACAGTVILSPEQAAQALEILRPLMAEEV